MSIGHRSPAEVPTIPPVDVRVDLEWAGCDGISHRSRVEEMGSTVFGVLAPLSPAATPPREGGPLSVRWRTSRGVYVLPVELLAVGTSGPVRLWWLGATGPVSVVQRRAYVRVPAAVVVRLDGPCGPSPAVSIDLSEGGLSCRLAGHRLDPWVFNEVSIPIDKHPLVAAIRTVRVSVEPVTGRRLLGAGFVDLPGDQAAFLRRHVYARESDLRKDSGRAG